MNAPLKSVKRISQSESLGRAQNNGRSTVSVRPIVLVDRSLFNLASHFDRPHMIKISPKALCLKRKTDLCQIARSLSKYL